MPVRELARAALRGYSAHALSQQAAAISFRLLFSLVPLVALVVSVVHVFLPAELADRLVEWLVDDLVGSPGLEESVQRAVVGGRATASVAGILAVVGLIWAASSLMSSIRRAFEAIWESAPHRSFVRGKLVDLALVLGTGVFAVAAFGLGIAAQAVAQLGGNLGDALGLTGRGDVLGEVMGLATALMVTFFSLAALYRVVPPVRPPWSAVVRGAVAGTIGFELATVAYGWYLARFGDLSVVYGSFGALLGFLLVVYAGVIAMLAGAELVAARAR
jgi:membrane protein